MIFNIVSPNVSKYVDRLKQSSIATFPYSLASSSSSYK